MSELYIVGIGPGSAAQMTCEARAALDRAEVIVGYDTYVKLVSPLYPEKEFRSAPMRREIERCRLALESAAAGKSTALICSGDAGVYGLAGPVLQLAPEYPEVGIEVIPGVTAALAGAAKLGAPLGHDFCCISLSDLLTPWETIERRLRAAAAGDFVICLYNPASRSRRDHLRRACEVLLESKVPETPCGYVRSIGREGQAQGLLTLDALRDFEADMFTTVFIGASQTESIGEKLVTPRGYRV